MDIMFGKITVNLKELH